MDFSVCVLYRFRPRWLEPDQLNACGGGGFCRRCCWSPRTRPAERLRQRWILPSSVGWLPAAAADRRQPQKKRRWGNLCLLPHAHPLACGGSAPPRKFLRWDGFQPLSPTGDSRKKRRWGNLCLLSHTHPLACGGDTPPRKPDLLTVISLSTRKSPGAAGALSLTPDGVSDPAEGATAQPAKRSRPRSKAEGAKQGKRERTRRGKRTV